MSTNSSIEWTDATWNPVSGCTRVSAGCDNCYATKMTYRLEKMGQPKYSGLTVLNPKGDRHFNGQVRTHEEALAIPFAWQRSAKAWAKKHAQPRRVFVNSMSDLFHKDVPFEFVDKVFAVMALCPDVIFQILTKRPERMAEFLITKDCPLDRDRWDIVSEWAVWIGKIVWDARGSEVQNYYSIAGGTRGKDFSNRRTPPGWPLPNVWLGTSIEDQPTADARIPHLLRCPAAVRFLSCEPLLSFIDFITPAMNATVGQYGMTTDRLLQLVIAGGESGPGARPMHPRWARSLRDQCQMTGVAYFFKQWGAFLGADEKGKKSFTYGGDVNIDELDDDDNPRFHKWPDGWWSIRANKHVAGRLLDGREWNELPIAVGKREDESAGLPKAMKRG